MIKVRPLEARDLSRAVDVVASAFTSRRGFLPPRFQPERVRALLASSLDQPTESTPRFLVAVDDADRLVAIAGYTLCRFAGATWSLTMGATNPADQGKGFGHALVLARLDAIRADGGGLVLVASKDPARFERYGFTRGPLNVATESVILWRDIVTERVT